MFKNIINTLPDLPENFNQNYYIKTSTVNIRLLRRSGYKILHRPYFAMKNSTHDAVTINPHKKECVDAAPISADAIFLMIF